MDAEDDEANPRRCAYPWCTTEHGRTSHPDDETHRSAGIEVMLELRHPAEPDRVREVLAEVGLTRRIDDDRVWLSIDDGNEVRCDVSAASARALLRVLLADPGLVRELRLHA